METTSWSTRPALPAHVQVEITGACNLACDMCLVAHRPKLKRRQATFGRQDFERLVDELTPPLERVTVQGLGEPLLVPHLEDMIAFASERGVRAGFNTNGMLLTRHRARGLLEAGLGWLHVSIDGARPHTHRAIRGDAADLERVVANLRGLLDLRGDSPRPHVEVVFVAMRRNVAELPPLVEAAAQWGVDRLSVQNLSHDFSDTDEKAFASIGAYARRQALFSDGASRHHAMRCFADARRIARRSGLDLRLPAVDARRRRRPGEPGCTWPWDGLYVRHDGTAQPCCMIMGSERAQVGNVVETSATQVWHGDTLTSFRQQLLGEEPPEVCRGCSVYRGVF